jgi:hypothetical protein
MDQTEVTNNEYRQFVYWVRDSVVARKMGYVKADKEGNERVDWSKMKTLKWSDPKVIEQLSTTDIILPPDDRIFGKKEIDPSKIIFHSEVFDLKAAAKAPKNADGTTPPRSKFIVKYDLPIYPDTLDSRLYLLLQ